MKDSLSYANLYTCFPFIFAYSIDVFLPSSPRRRPTVGQVAHNVGSVERRGLVSDELSWVLGGQLTDDVRGCRWKPTVNNSNFSLFVISLANGMVSILSHTFKFLSVSGTILSQSPMQTVGTVVLGHWWSTKFGLEFFVVDTFISGVTVFVNVSRPSNISSRSLGNSDRRLSWLWMSVAAKCLWFTEPKATTWYFRFEDTQLQKRLNKDTTLVFCQNWSFLTPLALFFQWRLWYGLRQLQNPQRQLVLGSLACSTFDQCSSAENIKIKEVHLATSSSINRSQIVLYKRW